MPALRHVGPLHPLALEKAHAKVSLHEYINNFSTSPLGEGEEREQKPEEGPGRLTVSARDAEEHPAVVSVKIVVAGIFA